MHIASRKSAARIVRTSALERESGGGCPLLSADAEGGGGRERPASSPHRSPPEVASPGPPMLGGEVRARGLPASREAGSTPESRLAAGAPRRRDAMNQDWPRGGGGRERPAPCPLLSCSRRVLIPVACVSSSEIVVFVTSFAGGCRPPSSAAPGKAVRCGLSPVWWMRRAGRIPRIGPSEGGGH